MQTGPDSLGCGTSEIFVNQELRISFSAAVDLASVNLLAFQIVDLMTGSSPAGSFTLDPSDPRQLVFRPQISFDSGGNPIFGFREDGLYLLRLPGTALDPLGPHIRSILGEPNRTRLQCSLVASLGVLDAVPGRPSVQVTVDVVTSYDENGDPDGFAFDVPADGATAVYRDTDIGFLFDDLLNPATVIDPVTGQSSTIHVALDPDGDVSDPSDQVPVAGSFTLTLDQQQNTTSASFRPSASLPPSGGGASPLKVVVKFFPAITDLGGNALIDPGPIAFEPEE